MIIVTRLQAGAMLGGTRLVKGFLHEIRCDGGPAVFEAMGGGVPGHVETLDALGRDEEYRTQRQRYLDYHKRGGYTLLERYQMTRADFDAIDLSTRMPPDATR